MRAVLAAILVIVLSQTARAELFFCERLYLITANLGEAKVTKEKAQLLLSTNGNTLEFKIDGYLGVTEQIIVNNDIVVMSASLRMRKTEKLLTHIVQNHLPAPTYISQYKCQ